MPYLFISVLTDFSLCQQSAAINSQIKGYQAVDQLLLISICLQSPDGEGVTPKIVDNGNGTYTITYTPEEVGLYIVDVLYGAQQVPGAPFNVLTSPTGDASKVKLAGQSGGTP